MKKERFAELVLARYGIELTTERLGQLKSLQSLLVQKDVMAVLADCAQVAKHAFSGLGKQGSAWKAALVTVISYDNPNEIIERLKFHRAEEGFDLSDENCIRRMRGSECWTKKQRRAAGQERRWCQARALRVA